MTLAQIGEFSFIIAGIGLTAGATRNFLYPVAVAVSAITTLTTPWLIRMSGPAASLVDRKLPRPAQTFAVLYGSWIERLRRAPDRVTDWIRVRRLAAWVLADAALLAAIALGFVAEGDRAAGWVSGWAAVGAESAGAMVVAAATAVAIPFAIGLFRTIRGLGLTLALLALPARADPKVDLAAAPRRALVVALQLAIVCVVGTPLLALAQLFLPPIRAPVIVAAIIAILVGVLWRHASDLQAHAQAGAEALVSLLKRQMAPLAGSSESNSLAEAHGALPGLGEPIFVRLRPGDYGVGRTLRELDLRSVTGAMVLSIAREGDALMLPVGGDQLRAGDALAVAGTTEAIDAARRLLQPGPSAAA